MFGCPKNISMVGGVCDSVILSKFHGFQTPISQLNFDLAMQVVYIIASHCNYVTCFSQSAVFREKSKSSMDIVPNSV